MKAAIRVKEMGGIPSMWGKGSWVRDQDTRRETQGGKSVETDNSSLPVLPDETAGGAGKRPTATTSQER